MSRGGRLALLLALTHGAFLEQALLPFAEFLLVPIPRLLRSGALSLAGDTIRLEYEVPLELLLVPLRDVVLLHSTTLGVAQPVRST